MPNLDESPLRNLLDLSGRTAIVSGAALGIGAAIAERFAELGAHVLLADIDDADALATVDRIRGRGGKAQFVSCDVRDPRACARVVSTAVETTDRLDILVNNAGIFPMADALQLDEATWDRVQAVNLKGAFFFAQAAANAMIGQRRGGSIVNIASVDAFHPSGALAHYDASKGGVVMLTKSLAFELAPSKIRVNAIAPGAIDTPGVQKAGMNPDILKAFLARIPLRRMGRPDDIARATAYLASDLAEYVTGSVLVVDGGYLLS